ncbi:hypothetical protein HB662_25590 [Roseomonas frigidaquae]|uniref:Sulfotransferase family protein n=1 Tax=Falsiroseomonas frigidaquae TaxID=487318 RepID=A0ABX1F718_9PROT|nr:hypothetical protein [Falsiroseomonas frigidaquae]NKE48178.1 hypothetical protein [Falsiroseomonas frigidaquae]
MLNDQAPDQQVPVQLIFVHLPKTGGFALHAALERALPADGVLRVGDSAAQQAFVGMSPEQVAPYAMVSGHFTFEEALARARPGARFATLLRDPVARLLSAFNYMSTWVDHPLHASFRDRGFAEFIADSGKELAAEACRQLTGRDNAAEAIPILEGYYGLVGTTARVPDVSRHLHRWLGLPPQVPGRENVTAGQGRVTLTSETCEQLLELTREDRKLFQHIANRHDGLYIHRACSGA